MQAIPLGKIINAAANTTTYLVLPFWVLPLLPPSGLVTAMTFCAAQADAGVVKIACKAPDGSNSEVIIAELSRSSLYPFESPESDTGLDATRFGIKPVNANEGAYVTLWVD